MAKSTKSKRYKKGDIVMIDGKPHIITKTYLGGIAARGKPVKKVR